MAEKATWPAYLVESDRVIVSDITDSVEREDNEARKIFDDRRLRVEGLVHEIG